jgi:hypothetical protein
MDVLKLLPHSCQHCRNIIIDSGPFSRHSSTWTLQEIQEFAKECMLFKLSLRLLTTTLKPPYHLDFEVVGFGEDLEYFEAYWKDTNKELVSKCDNAGLPVFLYVFAERGTFP